MDLATAERVQGVLATKGIKIDTAVLQDAIAEAEAPPDDPIPVSQGMIAAGRKVWLAHPDMPPRDVLAMIYRAMVQQQQDEEAAAQDAPAQPVDQQRTP